MCIRDRSDTDRRSAASDGIHAWCSVFLEPEAVSYTCLLYTSDDLILSVAGKIPECDLIAGESGVLCMGGTGISVSDATVHIV